MHDLRITGKWLIQLYGKLAALRLSLTPPSHASASHLGLTPRTSASRLSLGHNGNELVLINLAIPIKIKLINHRAELVIVNILT